MKGSQPFPNVPGNWADFRFICEDPSLPLNDVAKALLIEACIVCHQLAAA